jgi:hypothetical protein
MRESVKIEGNGPAAFAVCMPVTLKETPRGGVVLSSQMGAWSHEKLAQPDRAAAKIAGAARFLLSFSSL